MPDEAKPTEIEVWEVQESPDLYVMGPRGYPVCLVGGYANRHDYTARERERAHRIAALPLMEAACHALAGMGLEPGQYDLTDMARDDFPNLWRALGLAREALKKADRKDTNS